MPRGGLRHGAAFHALNSIDETVDQLVKEAGGELMTLHGKRNRADYDWKNLSVERQDQAQLLVERARGIVTTLEECLADEAREESIYDYYRVWVPAYGADDDLTLI